MDFQPEEMGLRIVEMTETEEEFESIKDEIYDMALHNYDEGIPSNFNVTRYQADIDPWTKKPIIRQTSLRVRPERRAVMDMQMLDINIDEAEMLPDIMNRNRVEETAAPFAGDRVRFERPEGNVLHTQDHHIFDPSLQTLLDGTDLDLELMATDIIGQKSVAKHEFDRPIIDEIDNIVYGKEVVCEGRKEYLRLAAEILRAVGHSVHANDDALVEKSNREIWTYVDSYVEEAAHNRAISSDTFGALQVLKNYMEDLESRAMAVESASTDTFRQTLTVGDYWFPDAIGDADGAIENFGISKRPWLHI
jgi:hypothetical protein